MPLWRENSYWSGLLIAIGNEFAASNAASLAEKRRRIRGICQLPAMARAIQAFSPRAWAGTNRLWLTWSAGGSSFSSRCCTG